MTGDEHEAQKIVADVIVDRCIEIAHNLLLFRLQIAAELFVLSLEHRPPPKKIGGAMFGSRHQPRAGIVGNARLRPLLERRHQRILRQLLGHADIADDARDAGDQPRRLDPPNRFNGAVCVGSRHSYRSHHLSHGLRNGMSGHRRSSRRYIPSHIRIPRAMLR